MIKRKVPDYKLFLFLLPSFAGLMAFYVIPFCYSFYLALLDNSIIRNFVGLKNFQDVLGSGAFQLAFLNTLKFMAVSVPLSIVIPLALAQAIQKTPGKKRLFSIIFLMPLVIPSGSVVHFWKSIFAINGALNRAFFQNHPVNWLESNWALAIILFIYIWKNAGYNMILFSAGLLSIPKDYYEYAALEGAGPVRQFFHVTAIYLVPTFFLAFLMSIIHSFKAFREIYMLAGAYPHQSIYTLQHYMNNQFDALNYQKLSAASYVLSIFLVIIILLFFRAQNRISKNL